MTTVSSAWPILHYDNTEAALRFLTNDVGFHQRLVVRNTAGHIAHVEMVWAAGGIVILGSTKHNAGVHAALRPEAMVNQSRRVARTLDEYGQLMQRCFSEFHRVLKPGRWMTVEFSNHSNRCGSPSSMP